MSFANKFARFFSDEPDFEYPCPECKVGYLVPDKKTFEKIEPQFSKAAHGAEEWGPEWITYRFKVTCICSKKGCGEVAFVSGSGGLDQRYDYDGHVEYYENFQIKAIFPAPRLCYIPDGTPKNVENLIIKSFSLYWIDVSAAANALRASLEILLDELKVPREEKNKSGQTLRMSLHRRLEIWAATEKENSDLCLALKEVGNLGSHGDVVKAKHYLGSLEIYSHVLKQLFENNAKKMKDLAQSIQDEIRTKKSSKILSS